MEFLLSHAIFKKKNFYQFKFYLKKNKLLLN